MANITLHDPLANRLNRIFNSLLWTPSLSDETQAQEPKLDLTEDDKNYTLRADMPGVKKEDIQVNIDGNRVSISAQVKKEKEDREGKTVVYSERFEGRMFRSFTLDEDVDPEKTSAKFSDGVLEVVMPKTGRANGKRVAIQ